jgi:orotidine-5'-phosphate decarboxylase
VWNYNHNVLLVTGATCPAELGEIRKRVGDSVALLVPGIGAQGGDLEGVLRNGLTADRTGLVINSSRGIIFASNGEDFAEAARREALKLRDAINAFRA